MKRDPNNPILTPTASPWESYAAFNPSIVNKGDTQVMLYRAIGTMEERLGHPLRISRIGRAEAKGGDRFEKRRILLDTVTPWDFFGCEDPRVTFFEGTFYIFYTALGGFPFSKENIKVGCAISQDLHEIDDRFLVTPFNAKAMTLFPERVSGKITAILTVNSDDPPSQIGIIQVDKIESLWDPMVWYSWLADIEKHTLSLERLNTDHIEVGAAPVLTDRGWLLTYAHIQNYSVPHLEKIFGFEAVLLDKDDPRKILARTDAPLLVPQEAYEIHGTVPNVIFPTSLVKDGQNIKLYYGATDTTVAMASISMQELFSRMTTKTSYPKAQKLHFPVIAPRTGLSWEANGTFNPGVWDDGEKVHVFYRCQSHDWTSTLGYARFNTPYFPDRRPLEPVYQPRESFEMKLSGQGYSGCEDPRLTQLGERVIMFYTAYDGVNPPRVAMTSIEIENIKAQRWRWSPPKLISSPEVMNKNASLFPELVAGKYAILHRIEPNICLELLTEQEFQQLGESYFLGQYATKLTGPQAEWESAKIGANCPPIKTEAGWLLIYHGVDKRTFQYRLGLMLLDLTNPYKILGRSPFPVMEPELPWECNGVVKNVVFPCGAIARGDNLFIYYGGADTSLGVGRISIQEVLAYLL